MESTPRTAFRYRPLDHESEIRLLRISFPQLEDASSRDAGDSKPGPGINAIAAEPTLSFKHYSLDSLPPYTALSYCWGDPTTSKPVPCQPEGELSVTPNLYEFLSTVPQIYSAAKGPLELVWIDAVCIDMSDPAERSSQVRQMGSIYERAKEVLVWLGPASEDSPVAATFVPELYNILRGIDDFASIRFSSVLEQTVVPTFEDPRWAALVNFLFRPYFGRLWVQQELILASSLSIICGTDWIEWDHLNLIGRAMYSLSVLAAVAWAGTKKELNLANAVHNWADRINHLAHAANYRELLRTSKKLPLLATVRSFRACESSDPRDKLYGLLAISAQPGDEEFDARYGWCESVDYLTSIEDVYTAFARSALLQGQSSDVLSLARDSSGARTCSSWVPDWRHDREGCCMSDRDQAYRAHGTTCTRFRSSTTPGSVRVQAQSVGIVKALVAPNLFSVDPEYASSNAWTWKQWRLKYTASAEDLAESLHPYFNGQSGGEACWQTLISDYRLSSSPIAADRNMRVVEIWKRVVMTRNKPLGEVLPDPAERDAYEEFDDALTKRVHFLFGITEEGMMGLFPTNTSVGDSVYLFYGHECPFVVHQRPADPNEELRYTLIGESYVHGIMNGEMVNEELATEITLE